MYIYIDTKVFIIADPETRRVQYITSSLKK